MTINFHRDYTLILGKPQREKNLLIPKSIVNPRLIENGTTPSGTVLPSGDYLDFNTIPATNWEIKGVQLKAKISQVKANSNPCEIEIVNGPENILKSIVKDDLVVLRAGYKNRDFNVVSAPSDGGFLPDLFVGQITQIVSSKQGTDRITRILSAEAITINKNVHISKTYLPLTTRYEVIQDLIKLAGDSGLPLGAFSLYESNYEWTLVQRPYLIGFSAKGMLMEVLESVCDSVNLNCYTAVGKLFIEPKSVPTKGNVFVVNASQVIGQPELLSDNTTTSSNEDDSADKQGIQLKLFLDGRISIEKLMRLNGVGEFDGDYSITGVVHELDYRSTSTWTTSVTLQKL